MAWRSNGMSIHLRRPEGAMPERNLLKIDVIRTDGATQPRAAIDFEAEKFPEI